MFEVFRGDLRAVLRNDPAAKGAVEVLLCHTPLHAIWLYRVAHLLHTRLRLPVVPRMLTVLGRFWAGVELHPGARIGARFFIDHGTGVVVGETAEIGDDCVLFHNVTLGGTGTTLLGPIRVGSHVKIGANSFIIMHDVPDHCTVTGTPGRVVRLNGERVDLPLEPTVPGAGSIPVQPAGEKVRRVS